MKSRKMNLTSLSQLKPYPKNAKKHDKKQIEQIAESIRTFGFNQPVVLDKNGTIVVGHGRFEAAKLLKMKSVPTITLDLPEAELKAYRLADNKLNESGWDMDLAIGDLKELNEELFNLTGFDADLLIEASDKDDVLPVNPPTVAKSGDLWALGEHRVLCGDSTSKEAVARLMGGKQADMVFTDPPYGVSYEEKCKRNGRKGSAKISGDGSVEEAAEVYGEVFKRISEVLSDGSSYYICAPQGGDQEEMMMMMRSTIPCRHQLIWKKDSAVFSMGRLDYDYQHEPILYGWIGSHKHIGGGQFKTSVWDIPRPKVSKLHPTMKPVELVSEAILNSSQNNDIILDLFLGSGSTLIAAEKTGRIAFGCEIDPKYVDVIIKRWETYTGKKGKKIVV